MARCPIEQVLANEEKHHRLTLEGLADADAGRLIDDADIAAWIERLETDPSLPVPQPKT